MPAGSSAIRVTQFKAGDGGDGRQGLAAEAKGCDRKQIVAGANLGSGVAFKGKHGVVAAHAVAVVGDADELSATGLDFNADAGCTGIEGVLEQLLDHRRGTIHHFAGGDLVGNLVGEDADAAHLNSP